jgi:oligopeptide transport system substrate-binding protein
MNRPPPRFARALAFLALLALATTTGCGRRESPVDVATREGILLLGNNSDPATLDPQLVTSLSDARISEALFEGLTIPDPVTLAPRPGVAESWEYDNASLTWTFHLRADAKWSNGDPVTARDFVFAYRRMLNPALGADYANMLYPIKNAQAFNQGKLKDFAQVGVHAVDARTLKIQLEHPTSYFLALTYHQTYLPLHPPTILKFGAMDRRDTGWDKPGTFVGNGPFILTKYVLGEVVEVKKNPLYWDAAHVRLNGIRFFPITDLDAEEHAFRNGLLHVTFTIPMTKIVAYREQHSPYLRIIPVYGQYFYTFNTRKPPLNDPRVRLALCMAIDRKTLVEDVVRGGQLPTYSLTPDSAAYQPLAKLTEDIPAARQLLAAAGYPGGKGFPPVELLYNTSEGHRAVAEAIQQMWRENLGVDVHLAHVAAPTWLARRSQADYQIIRAGWYGDYLDPTTFLDLYRSDNPMEQSGWSNPKYDEYMAAAAAEIDPATRFADLQKAEAVLMSEVPFIPLYEYTTTILIRPVVRGYANNLLDLHPFTDIYLDPQATAPEPQKN